MLRTYDHPIPTRVPALLHVGIIRFPLCVVFVSSALFSFSFFWGGGREELYEQSFGAFVKVARWLASPPGIRSVMFVLVARVTGVTKISLTRLLLSHLSSGSDPRRSAIRSTIKNSSIQGNLSISAFILIVCESPLPLLITTADKWHYVVHITDAPGDKPAARLEMYTVEPKTAVDA